MTELQHVKLSYEEARQITTDIRNSVENVWTLLKKAHDGQAWSAVGYPTWEEYVKQEFQMGRAYAYRMIDYAKVQEALSPIGDTPKTESQARPLAKLETPEQQREAWKIAKEESGGKPTAKHVEAAVEVVKAKAEQPQQAAKPSERPQQRGSYEDWTKIQDLCDQVKEIVQELSGLRANQQFHARCNDLYAGIAKQFQSLIKTSSN